MTSQLEVTMPNMRHHFAALLAKVNPPAARRDTAATKAGEVREYLREHKFPTAAPHTRLSGSYSRNTAIEMIPDVDILTFLPEDQLERTPNAVLLELHAVLKGFPGGTIDTRGQRRSVRISLGAEDLHLDVVPAVANAGSDKPLKIPDRPNQEWILSDPGGYGARLSELNQKHGGKLVPLIKLAKAWRDEKMKRRRPKSYVLEVILLEGVEAGVLDPCGRSTAQNVHDMFEYITDRFAKLMDEGTESPRIRDPQVMGSFITRGWEREAFEACMNRAREARRAATRALKAATEIEAGELWKQVFGTRWPDDEAVKKCASEEAADVKPGEAKITPSGLIVAGALGLAAVALAARLTASQPTRYHGG